MNRRLEEYDPYLDTVRADPYAWYPVLQEQCPVHHYVLPPREVEKINDNPLVARPTSEFWTVTRRDDIVSVLQDATTFINGQGQGPERTEAPDGIGMLVFADEPHHKLQRRLVAYAFTPRTIDAMCPHIESIATSLVDAFADRGSCDLVEEFVNHLPVTVIATMLGVPVTDGPKLLQWVEDVVDGFGGNEDAYERSAQSAFDMIGYFMAEVYRRRASVEQGEEQPDDLINTLMTASYDGRQFNDTEIGMACQVILIAGSDTTTATLGNAFHLMCTHPTEREHVLADPSLWDNAVEEILRYHSPGQGLFRTTTQATEIAGCPIPEDAKVRVMFAAANWDKCWMPDADEFRVDRPLTHLRQHLAFGTGPHSCIGAALARAMIRISLQVALPRLPNLRLDPESPGERIDNFFMWGWDHLPVQWDISR